MADKSGRHKDTNWNLPTNQENGGIETWDAVKIAVLMDLRDELKIIRETLQGRLGHNSSESRELRGLRRDVKARLKPRCHRAHR